MDFHRQKRIVGPVGLETRQSGPKAPAGRALSPASPDSPWDAEQVI